MPTDSTKWLSSGALAGALADVDIHLSPAALQRYAREGRLPARVTPGGHYRFDLAQVREALESSTRARAGERAMSPIERLFEHHRDDIRQIAARHHGRAIYIFGSVARGDARPGSDLDFLVDFEPGSSLFDLMRITDELEELLGCRVDVVSRGGLKDRDTHILEEAQPV
jgi:hypothetical protein